ncbi:MAG: hypothetical protein ACREJU_05500 [Nitrospiraceae bacterium]
MLALARTLDSGKPVKEPQTNRAGDIENHLADLDLHVIAMGYSFHLISLLIKAFRGYFALASFLTDPTWCVTQKLHVL